MDTSTEVLPLEPLPYQQALADHLASVESEAWPWFSQELAGPQHEEKVRLDLLKATYRVDRESKPELYDLADKVRERFGVTAPLTLYQMQQAPESGLNAVLFYIPGEMHIAFVGPVLERLQGNELIALFGHEVGHFLLLELWDCRFRIAEELLNALVQDQSSQPARRVAGAAQDPGTLTARPFRYPEFPPRLLAGAILAVVARKSSTPALFSTPRGSRTQQICPSAKSRPWSGIQTGTD